MLEYRKLYIDSRFRTSDSVSSSNFKIELPVTLNLPEGCDYHLCDIAIPYTWTSVEDEYNDKLYLVLTGQSPTFPYPKTFTYSKINLDRGNYAAATFATALQAKLGAGIFTVTADTNNNDLTISMISNPVYIGFHFLTDKELADKRFYFSTLAAGISSIIDITGFQYDVNNLQSANYIIKNVTSNKLENTPANPFVVRFLEFHHTRNIYITSPNFGVFDSLAVKGMNLTSMIKKRCLLMSHLAT